MRLYLADLGCYGRIRRAPVALMRMSGLTLLPWISENEPSRKLVNRVVRGCSQALTSMVFAVTIATVTIRLGLPGKGNRRYSSYARSYARRESPIVGRKLCRRGLGCPHSTLRGRCNI